MFMVYSPQAPVPLSNGPTIIEAQVETVVDMIKKLESENAASIEATKQAEMECKLDLWVSVVQAKAKGRYAVAADADLRGVYSRCVWKRKLTFEHQCRARAT